MSSKRRNILAALLASPTLAMIGSKRIAAQPTLGLDLTPDCHDGDDHTVAQIEGPYFKPNALLKAKSRRRCAEGRKNDDWRIRTRHRVPTTAEDNCASLAR